MAAAANPEKWPRPCQAPVARLRVASPEALRRWGVRLVAPAGRWGGVGAEAAGPEVEVDAAAAAAATTVWGGEPVLAGLLGVREPGSGYQRWRTPDRAGWFQWYYFWLHDAVRGMNWALTVAAVYCDGVGAAAADEGACPNAGAYVGFVAIDQGVSPTSQAAYASHQRVDKYPLAWLKASTATQDLAIVDPETLLPLVKVQASDNGEEVHVAAVSGAKESKPLLGAGEFRWNVKLLREFGWFGQSQLEWGARVVGVLQWSTYMHRAKVAGQVKAFLADKGSWVPIVSDLSPAIARGYGDSNWGHAMLRPPPGAHDYENYEWGWFVAGGTLDSGEEFSVAAGVGRSYMPIMGVLQAKFCDFRIGDRVKLEIVHVVKEDLFDVAVGLSNHGLVSRYHVTRGGWREAPEALGGGRIPMEQNVTIAGAFGEVSLNFQAPEGCYTRLPFWSPDGSTFGDFECLGALAQVSLRAKRGSELHGLLGGQDFHFSSRAAGLEFGFRDGDGLAEGLVAS